MFLFILIFLLTLFFIIIINIPVHLLSTLTYLLPHI